MYVCIYKLMATDTYLNSSSEGWLYIIITI